MVLSLEMSSQGHADRSAVLLIMVPWSPCIQENLFLLAPKPWGWWENPPAVRRGTFWMIGPRSDTSLPPHTLYFFCQGLSHAGSQGRHFGCTPPWCHHQRLLQGFNHEGGIQGTVFSIKMGCRAKRNLFFLSYFPHR